MDCRKWCLVAAAALMACGNGCMKWNLNPHATVPPPPPPGAQAAPTPAAAPPAPTAATPTAATPTAAVPMAAVPSWPNLLPKREEKKRTPLPGTLVALGKLREEEAGKCDNEPIRIKVYDQAREAYQEALKIDAEHLPAYQGLARVYIRLGDHNRAVETYQRAIKKFPKNGGLWHDLAMCHNCRKNWNEAVDSLDHALKIDPENRQFAQTLGFTLAMAGRTDDSLKVLTQAYGLAHAHYGVAKALYQQRRDDECKHHLRLAIEANPAHRQAREFLASLERPPSAPAPAPGSAAAAAPGSTPAQHTQVSQHQLPRSPASELTQVPLGFAD